MKNGPCGPVLLFGVGCADGAQDALDVSSGLDVHHDGHNGHDA